MLTKILSIDASDEIVTVEEAMAHSRIEDEYDNELVCAQIMAATDLVERWVNRKLHPTDMVGVVEGFRNKISLPYPPINAVSEVVFINSDGTETSLTEGDDYIFDDVWEHVKILTQPSGDVESTRVYFSCGYQEACVIPMAIKHAIKQTFATLYENREDTVIGASVNSVPLTAMRMLGAYRVKQVA